MDGAWTLKRFVLQHERCRDRERGLDIRRRVNRKQRVMTSDGFVVSVGSGGETRNGAS